MKFATIVGSLLFSGIATAQDIQSKPFNLVIQSKDKTLDGQRFGACHTGAAIESLCLSGRDGSDFYFNTTKGAQTPIKGYVAPGVLVYNLPIGMMPMLVPVLLSLLFKLLMVRLYRSSRPFFHAILHQSLDQCRHAAVFPRV